RIIPALNSGVRIPTPLQLKVCRPSGADHCWCDRALIRKVTPMCDDSRVTACG
ncbi:unnamed protein product, partial [Musa banksii]